MATFTIVADPKVKSDLQAARDFLNSKRKGYGTLFLAEYRKALKTLEKNPFFEIRYQNIRCLPLNKFKYMIHFKVEEDQKSILVYAVLSTHLDPQSHWL
ncbi:MAG: hypothetical protein KAX93_04670 [Flavobacterium sp.]|nr:hypothetical protein [Flavobacterium sp.]